MGSSRVKFAIAVAVVGAAVTTGAAVAGNGPRQRAVLSGYNELPLTLNSPGTGRFTARIDRSGQEIRYRLTYAGLTTPVLQAHIHFGREFVAGGIAAFLCSNLGNAPAGTPACPASPATVTGTIRPADVVGPADQGISPGDFDALVRAIRAGATYANVHTQQHPGGEIRGQIGGRDRGRDR